MPKDKRFEWDDVIPSWVAQRQRQWERRQTILRMLALGYTVRETAKHFGVSHSRVHQIHSGHMRRVKRTGRPKPSPVELFLAYGGFQERSRLADIWIAPWDRITPGELP
jgi:hypothetical protein